MRVSAGIMPYRASIGKNAPPPAAFPLPPKAEASKTVSHNEPGTVQRPRSFGNQHRQGPVSYAHAPASHPFASHQRPSPFPSLTHAHRRHPQ